jgi:tRNA-dihydrouridine synthase
MKYYLAPMEGISGHVFRNALKHIEGCGADKYYMPFISPRPGIGMREKERFDMLPENNEGMILVPQILTNDAEAFIMLGRMIREEYGWEEINLNAGCPSGTVTGRGRGAGMLKDTDALEAFLDRIFEADDLNISVKTRIGIEDPSEFEKIMKLYEKYPIYELTVHPRTLKEQYRPGVHMEAFELAAESKLPLVYNGDIFTAEDNDRLTAAYGERLSGVMAGRGIIADSALFRKLKGGNGLAYEEFMALHDEIFSGYEKEFDGDMPLLFHMKELWSYWGKNFTDEKGLKAIRKTKNKNDYRRTVKERSFIQ